VNVEVLALKKKTDQKVSKEKAKNRKCIERSQEQFQKKKRRDDAEQRRDVIVSVICKESLISKVMAKLNCLKI
jgi:hypothetical protein